MYSQNSLIYILFLSSPPPHTNFSPTSTIPFPNHDFLVTATRWTRNKIFPSTVNQTSVTKPANQFLGGPYSPPPISSSPISVAYQDPAQYYTKPTIELSSKKGAVLVSYPNVAQLWEFLEEKGAFCLTGSTFGVNGKIISGHMIDHCSYASSDDSNEDYNEDYDDNEDCHSDYNNSETPSDRHNSKLNNPLYVLLQVLVKNDIQLQVHELNKKPSFVKSLVLPPASSGPGPYTIFNRQCKSTIAVITKSGAVTLYSIPEFRILPLSGLETGLNAEGMPLFDLCGRWLIYSPTGNAMRTGLTPVKMAGRKGIFMDRILDNLSSSTAASLKTLTEVGVAGIKHYLGGPGKDLGSKSGSPNLSPGALNSLLIRKEPERNGNCVNYLGSNTPPNKSHLSSLFSNSTATSAQTVIQIMDLESQAEICTFVTAPASYLSISPYDPLMAVVSSKGDCVYTYDLSFTPKVVRVVDKFVRGKTPGVVTMLEWDEQGGLGIGTKGKGSVHWFGRGHGRSNEYWAEDDDDIIDTDSLLDGGKKWKLSGWSVTDMCMISSNIGEEPEMKTGGTGEVMRRKFSNPDHQFSGFMGTTKYSNIAMLREGEIIIVNIHSGECMWKYELPSHPISETFMGDKLELRDSPVTPDDQITEPGFTRDPIVYRDLDSFDGIDPISFYEKESCLPYPFLYTDRYATLATAQYDQQDHEFMRGIELYGLAIKYDELDFGRAKGLAVFEPMNTGSPSSSSLEEPSSFKDEFFCGPPAGKSEELQRAMESLVISPTDEFD